MSPRASPGPRSLPYTLGRAPLQLLCARQPSHARHPTRGRWNPLKPTPFHPHTRASPPSTLRPPPGTRRRQHRPFPCSSSSRPPSAPPPVRSPCLPRPPSAPPPPTVRASPVRPGRVHGEEGGNPAWGGGNRGDRGARSVRTPVPPPLPGPGASPTRRAPSLFRGCLPTSPLTSRPTARVAALWRCLPPPAGRHWPPPLTRPPPGRAWQAGASSTAPSTSATSTAVPPGSPPLAPRRPVTGGSTVGDTLSPPPALR